MAKNHHARWTSAIPERPTYGFSITYGLANDMQFNRRWQPHQAAPGSNQEGQMKTKLAILFLLVAASSMFAGTRVFFSIGGGHGYYHGGYGYGYGYGPVTNTGEPSVNGQLYTPQNTER